ncbi:Nse4-domain-containing protein [Decorospora gaudefroyi]|uniref:Non-structural maintenance of chromosomes element 4 n=1 Tax=Decorospora gaudefroyi TaxID=184978 RepID=A0A6A5K232_9PLEO|nr:Nse4-domain-containing protein [Decorospora gaudefroyi]
MARLNTHLSATPQTRASTVDSMYRDPSVAPRPDSSARTQSYSVLSPTRSISSDKENEQPESRENTPRSGKPRGLRGASVRMLTPDSGSTTSRGSRGSKRRRTDEYSMAASSRYDGEQDDDAHQVQTPSEVRPDEARDPEEEEGDLKYYNPNQDPEQRRRLRATMRDHQRMVDDNRDQFIKSNDTGLADAIKTQNSLYSKVRQTADATVDSRFLVNASDLAAKKLNNSLGNSGVGIDPDQFISKCIYFMKSGGHIAGEENAPAVPVAEDDDDEDPDGLDWALLGRQACFPCNRRPPTSAFLLGPLSVQKRVRTTQRKARSQRQALGPATRPQELKEGDMQPNENANLSNLVKGIRSQLQFHLEKGIHAVEDELAEIPDEELEDEDQVAAFRRHRMAMAQNQEAAVSLLDFAINPHDFGQTVENLFYISFLVREGNAKVIQDDDTLPLLIPAEPRGVSEQREANVQKHQAVFSIDYPTWHMFIQAFDIREPLIPHRNDEEEKVGPNAWFSG